MHRVSGAAGPGGSAGESVTTAWPEGAGEVVDDREARRSPAVWLNAYGLSLLGRGIAASVLPLPVLDRTDAVARAAPLPIRAGECRRPGWASHCDAVTARVPVAGLRCARYASAISSLVVTQTPSCVVMYSSA
jgi:hypothetical protein